MLRIDIDISQSTIDLENNRNPDKLSLDELLYWTFETRVDFIIESAERSLLLVPEAALFQILQLISTSRRHFLNDENMEIFASDREGTYALVIKNEGENVVIRDDFYSTMFRVSLTDFLKAADSFIKKAIEEVEMRCPNLIMNDNYQKLKTELIS